ncbi:MAG: hypothetical protein IT428_27505, partial [Planctomycetaceae bacterium]|nr:hypothetical protein [Planctomycetaceae bacterium]
MTRRMLLLVALSAGFLSFGGFGPNVCEAQTKTGWYYKIKYMNWSKTAWETHTRGPHSSKFNAESALQKDLQVHYQYYPSVVKRPYRVA